MVNLTEAPVSDEVSTSTDSGRWSAEGVCHFFLYACLDPFLNPFVAFQSVFYRSFNQMDRMPSVVSGHGLWFTSDEGKEYLDACGAALCFFFFQPFSSDL